MVGTDMEVGVDVGEEIGPLPSGKELLAALPAPAAAEEDRRPRGRPKEGRRVSINLPDEVLEWLDGVEGGNRSRAVRNIAIERQAIPDDLMDWARREASARGMTRGHFVATILDAARRAMEGQAG